MSELVVEAIAVAVDEHPVYRPTSALAGDACMLELAHLVSQMTGEPIDRARFLDDNPDRDITSAALAALGPSSTPQPLYLVQSDADPDPLVAVLPRIVQGIDWVQEELGITHLEELGGTAVMELLSWSVGDAGATVVIVDKRPIIDGDLRPSPVVAVALRVRRGDGPLRIVGWGEGAPSDNASHCFSGVGACDAWLALHAALATKGIPDGARVRLHTRGQAGEGWALLEIADAADVRTTRGAYPGQESRV